MYQTLFYFRFLSAEICNRSVFPLSSINCTSYMSNFPVTLSEKSHPSLSGPQLGDRCPEPRHSPRKPPFLSTVKETPFVLENNDCEIHLKCRGMCYRLRMQRNLCTKRVRAEIIRSKDRPKRPSESLQRFSSTSFKKDTLSLLLRHVHDLGPIAEHLVFICPLFKFLSPSCCMFFVDLSIFVSFSFCSLLFSFATSLRFLMTKEHVSC